MECTLSFDDAFKFTLQNEGGYGNDKADHGGPTNFGITQDDLSRWRHQPASAQDVKEMSLHEAKAIYEAWYWRAVGCDKITSKAIAICMFDFSVLRGISIPPRYAQAICNNHGAGLVLDGKIGPKTLQAINSLDPMDFVSEFSAKARNGFLGIVARRPSQVRFLKGWLARAKRLLTLVGG